MPVTYLHNSSGPVSLFLKIMVNVTEKVTELNPIREFREISSLI